MECECLYGLRRITQYDDAGDSLYFMADTLGNVRQLIDADGEVNLVREYEPYSEVLSEAGEAFTSYGFTGAWVDKIGFLYMRARYINPLAGCFTFYDTWANSVITRN